MKKYFDNTESITNSAATRMAANGTDATVSKDLSGAKKHILKKYFTALDNWDVVTLSTFQTSGLTSIQEGYHIHCAMPECGCRDLVNLASYLRCGDIVTTRERVDLLIEWGFISLTDIDFLLEVLSFVGCAQPNGWSPKVFNHLFYKMDKKSLGAHRYRIPDYPADMSIAHDLYQSHISTVYSLEYMDYLFTECGYTVRDTDWEFLSIVWSPEVVRWLCTKHGCDPNKKDQDGLIPFYQYLSTWVDFDKPAWTDSENLPPHVYRDSLGLDIWQMFLAYVSAGMDVTSMDTDGHTMEDYFSHLTVCHGWDGPNNDSCSVLDWFLEWKAKQ